jgi:hypothetical protein
LYYLGTILGGEFGSGDGPELRGRISPECGTYEPVWLPIDRLLVETVYPASICKLIQDCCEEWWNPAPPILRTGCSLTGSVINRTGGTRPSPGHGWVHLHAKIPGFQAGKRNETIIRLELVDLPAPHVRHFGEDLTADDLAHLP